MKPTGSSSALLHWSSTTPMEACPGKFQTSFQWSCVGVGENAVQKILLKRLAYLSSNNDLYKCSFASPPWQIGVRSMGARRKLHRFQGPGHTILGIWRAVGDETEAKSKTALAVCHNVSSSRVKVSHVVPAGTQICAWCIRLRASYVTLGRWWECCVFGEKAIGILR